MEYWIGLLFIEILLLVCYKNSVSEKRKRVLFWGIVFVLVYFSGFRDGLGMDYSAYKDLCERVVYNDSLLWLSEPLFRAIQTFCYNTPFSAVVLFLVNAFVTCSCCLWVYSKSYNFVLAAFVFIFYTDIYLSSMNIVAQYTAASMILLGYFYYMKDRKGKTQIILLCSILFATSIHLSSVFMILPMFFSARKINISFWVLLILLSFVTPMEMIFRIPILGDIINYLNYGDYMSYTLSGIKKLSMTNLYINMLIVPFFLKFKSKIKNHKNESEFIFLIKMFAMYLILGNLSTGNLTITYRLAVFFVVFLPLLLAKLPQIMDKQLAYIIIIVPLLILLSTRLATGDRLTVPDRILPINSLLDRYYDPYIPPYAS